MASPLPRLRRESNPRLRVIHAHARTPIHRWPKPQNPNPQINPRPQNPEPRFSDAHTPNPKPTPDPKANPAPQNLKKIRIFPRAQASIDPLLFFNDLLKLLDVKGCTTQEEKECNIGRLFGCMALIRAGKCPVDKG